MSAMPSVDVSPTARDVEVVCCTDCCAKFSRTPKPGVPSPSISAPVLKGTTVDKVNNVALPTLVEKK